jgi:hypothetical protein
MKSLANDRVVRVPMGGCSAAVLRSAEGSASRSTLYRRSFRIRGPRRSRRGPSQVGGGRRDVAAYRQPPTPLPSAPRLPPFEPAQPASTRSDPSRPLGAESQAPEPCFALLALCPSRQSRVAQASIPARWRLGEPVRSRLRISRTLAVCDRRRDMQRAATSASRTR